MRPEEIMQEINKLKLSEKLLLIEDVWDSIALSDKDLSMQEWQKKELNKRYSEFRDKQIDLHDWHSVHEDLRNKFK